MSNENTPGITHRKALIVGCGIAGPVLAMFLKRAGIDPVIYEGRPEPKDEAGFFLNLAPNGFDVLNTLGIKEDDAGGRHPDHQHRLPESPGQEARGEP
jgi:2-polyprenyl-6-methoxyphenol hydroxylase-like FAD-dependent oxidoreductase